MTSSGIPCGTRTSRDVYGDGRDLDSIRAQTCGRRLRWGWCRPAVLGPGQLSGEAVASLGPLGV